jgi:tetratricopeptide (TPR) repeat protein
MFSLDPTNPVISFCLEGTRAEFEGRIAAARQLYQQAWEAARDDFEACVAAHYCARHQPDPRVSLHWNLAALAHADAVGDERVRNFYPSLYLNLGYSYELLGDLARARDYYDRAADLGFPHRPA